MIVSKRMKDLGIFMSGLTYSPTDLSNKDEGILVLRSSNIQNGKLVYADNVYVNCHLDTNQMVKENDVLICSRNGSARLVGKTAIIPYGLKATWGAFMMLFRPYKKNSNYLNYVFSSQIEKYKGMFSTSTINQLTNSMLGNMFIDYEEDGNVQQRIVTYLDTKLSEIDTQMSILTSKRDAYLRLKKSIINHAVTRGLNPNVKMKDSGIEWIGEVPEHWKVKRMKDICVLSPNIKSCSEYEYGSYLPMEGLRLDQIETSDKLVSTLQGKYTPFEDSDLLVAKVTPCFENGNIAIAKGLTNGVGFGSSEIFVLRANKYNNIRFLFYMSLSSKFQDKACATMCGVGGLKRISPLFMKTYIMAIPPSTEQRAIATYLDDKCAKIDTIVSNLDKQISRYADLKRSLIDEVITGKRAV